MSTNYSDLVVERQRAWHEAHELITRAADAGRDMTADEQAKWNRIAGPDGVLDRLDRRIAELRDQADRDTELASARSGLDPFLRPATTSSPAGNAEWRQFFTTPHAVGFSERDLLTTSSGAGGATVPTGFLPALRSYLTKFSSIYRIGATIIPTADGRSLAVPVNTVAGTAAIVGEGTAIGESDPVFSSVTMNAWKYGRLLQVSSELLTDTEIDLGAFIARDSARALALAYGPDFVSGNGTNKPTGMLVGLGTATTIQTGSTGVPSYANLVDTVHAVPAEYRQVGCSWLMSDSAVAACRKIVDTTGRPIWQPTTIAGQPDTLLGFPVTVDSHVTAIGTAAGTSIAFGDFSGYYVRDCGVQFDRSADFAFSSDLQTYRVLQRLDGKWVDSSGAKILKSPTS